MRLAGDGRLDGVLGRSQAELDQLAVNHLKYFFIDILKTFFSCKIIYLILDTDSTDLKVEFEIEPVLVWDAAGDVVDPPVRGAAGEVVVVVGHGAVEGGRPAAVRQVRHHPQRHELQVVHLLCK